MKPIYLDYNATTPLDPHVAEAMMPYLREHFGNPSSGHAYGQKTRAAVDKARSQVAALLGCHPGEIFFTSGGTESNNWAIKGVAAAHCEKGLHIITSEIEHPAVTEVCRYLEEIGYKVTYLPVDEYGLVDPAAVEDALTPETILVSIMHANNEVGTVEPIAEIAEITQRHGVLLHTDAAQSMGKIPVRVDELGVDLLSVAGHKLYAPEGVGALFIREGVDPGKFMHGAGHEAGRRAGTENVIGIVGLGEACELVERDLPRYRQDMRRLRDRLESGLKARLPDLCINGHPERRLPNTSSIGFKGMKANELLAGMPGIAASAGAACHQDDVRISSVLAAMRVPDEVARGTVRFSVGREITEFEIERAVEIIAEAVE